MSPDLMPSHDPQADAFSAKLESIVRPHLKLLPPGAPLGWEQSLGEAGLDSMASIDLLMDLEEQFGVAIPDEALAEDSFSSLDSLQRLLDSVAVG